MVAALMAVMGCGARLDPGTGTSTAPVEIELPLGLDAVRQRLGDLFAKGDGTAPARRLAPGDWLACFTLFDRRPPGAGAQSVFPSDAALRVGASGDAAMNRYLASGAEERAQDVFLYDARDCKWVSEYRARGRPVRFSCDFILHLEAVGAHATRMDALEVRPQVVIGSRLGFTAHGLGIGWVETRRAVAPTRRDRVELLARIRASLDDAAGVPPDRRRHAPHDKPPCSRTLDTYKSRRWLFRQVVRGMLADAGPVPASSPAAAGKGTCGWGTDVRDGQGLGRCCDAAGEGAPRRVLARQRLLG